MIRFLLLPFLTGAALELASTSVRVSTIRNFRPVSGDLIYRSAALDELSIDDAKYLMSGGKYFSTILDLRNEDEI